MGLERKIRSFFGIRTLSLKEVAILIIAVVFLGVLVTLGANKIITSIREYTVRYYEPKDFQREEMLEKKDTAGKWQGEWILEGQRFISAL